MIRCSWCGAQNYAIDSWCSNCSRHLDWAPPSGTLPSPPPPPRADVVHPEPPHRPRHRRLILLAPSLAALVVAIAVALPVASWFDAARRAPSPALPNTAMQPLAPTAPAASAAPAVPSATPVVTPSPDATPTPDATALPDENSSPAAPPVAEPAALWTPRMQAQYPPAVYIDHRFAATQQINLRGARMVGARGGLATVYVDVIEVIDGQRRQWAGTWQLVLTTSGWLLNRPNLRAES
jgi:hypothetical protein